MRCRGGLHERLPRCQIHSPILLARGGGVFLCGERFLGFANFYCCFIFYYSRVAPPLTQLTSTKLPFLWTPDAEDGIGSWDVLIIPSSTDLSSGTQSLMNLYHQCVVAPASRDVGALHPYVPDQVPSAPVGALIKSGMSPRFPKNHIP